MKTTMAAMGFVTAILISVAFSDHQNGRGGLPISSAFSVAASSPSPSRRRNVILPLGPGPDAASPVLTGFEQKFKHNQQYVSRRIDRIVVLASPPLSQRGGTSDNGSTRSTSTTGHSSRGTAYLHAWVAAITSFIIANAKFRPFPLILFDALSRQQWALVHALSSMLFSGTIILSALMEYSFVASRKAPVIKFWFLSVPRELEAMVVLPALAGTVVSGMAQATANYGGLATSPKHIVGAFHMLLTFGLWWVITDVTSQRRAVEVVQEMNDDDVSGDEDVEIPTVLKMRAVTNVVSCLLVVGLYALMVLKPGLG